MLDWNMGSGVATLIALDDGTASLYLSTGGGVIGGAFHDRVRHAALQFLASLESTLSLLSPDPNDDLPSEGRSALRAMTANGRFIGTAPTIELGENRHPLSPAFHAAQAVIAELRMVADSKA
jgi:hypothetical protein